MGRPPAFHKSASSYCRGIGEGPGRNWLHVLAFVEVKAYPYIPVYGRNSAHIGNVFSHHGIAGNIDIAHDETAHVDYSLSVPAVWIHHSEANHCRYGKEYHYEDDTQLAPELTEGLLKG